MKSEDQRVDCKKCGKKCTPRLWHLKTFFTKQKIQHLCPYCGNCMYVSGGGLSALTWVFLAVFGLPLLASVILSPLSNTDSRYKAITSDIQRLESKVEQYSKEIASLEEKTRGGNNPQLVKSLETKKRFQSKQLNSLQELKQELNALNAK